MTEKKEFSIRKSNNITRMLFEKSIISKIKYKTRFVWSCYLNLKHNPYYCFIHALKFSTQQHNPLPQILKSIPLL